MSHIKIFPWWTAGHHHTHEQELQQYLDDELQVGYHLTQMVPVVDPAGHDDASYVQLIVVTEHGTSLPTYHIGLNGEALDRIGNALEFILEEIRRK